MTVRTKCGGDFGAEVYSCAGLASGLRPSPVAGRNYADSRYAGYKEPTFLGLAGETSIAAVFGECTEDPEPPLTHVVIDTAGALDPESPDADQPGGPPTGWIPVEGHSGIVVAEDDGVRYWTNSRSGAEWMAMSHAQPWGDTLTEFSYRFAAGAHPRQMISVQPRNSATACERVMLRISPERFLLRHPDAAACGAVEKYDTTAAFFSQPDTWYDVRMKTYGDKAYVWVRPSAEGAEEPEDRYQWAYLETYTEPVVRTDSVPGADPNTEGYTPIQGLGSDLAYAALFPLGIDNPGTLQLRDLTITALPCPDAPELSAEACADVVISEIHPNGYDQMGAGITYNGQTYYDPWIELYNRSDSEMVELQHWLLTDSPGSAQGYVFPDSLEIGPGARVLVFLPPSNEPGYKQVSLSAEGGELALLCPKDAGLPPYSGQLRIHYDAPDTTDGSIVLDYFGPGAVGAGDYSSHQEVAPTPGEEANLDTCIPGKLHFRIVQREKDRNRNLRYSQWFPWPPDGAVDPAIGVMDTTELEFKFCGAEGEVDWVIGDDTYATSGDTLEVFVDEHWTPEYSSLTGVFTGPYLVEFPVLASTETQQRLVTVRVNTMQGYYSESCYHDPEIQIPINCVASEYSSIYTWGPTHVSPTNWYALYATKKSVTQFIEDAKGKPFGRHTGDNNLDFHGKEIPANFKGALGDRTAGPLDFKELVPADGRANAVRHMYLSALLSLEIQEGPAREILAFHEWADPEAAWNVSELRKDPKSKGPTNELVRYPVPELQHDRVIDMLNNEIGLGVARYLLEHLESNTNFLYKYEVRNAVVGVLNREQAFLKFPVTMRLRDPSTGIPLGHADIEGHMELSTQDALVMNFDLWRRYYMLPLTISDIPSPLESENASPGNSGVYKVFDLSNTQIAYYPLHEYALWNLGVDVSRYIPYVVVR